MRNDDLCHCGAPLFCSDCGGCEDCCDCDEEGAGFDAEELFGPDELGLDPEEDDVRRRRTRG